MADAQQLVRGKSAKSRDKKAPKPEQHAGESGIEEIEHVQSCAEGKREKRYEQRRTRLAELADVIVEIAEHASDDYGYDAAQQHRNGNVRRPGRAKGEHREERAVVYGED